MGDGWLMDLLCSVTGAVMTEEQTFKESRETVLKDVDEARFGPS